MKTVLIVEDEKMIRLGIKAMVQRSGVPIETILDCSNGLAALEILEKEDVDVMFTDIRMPKMDGIELVSRVQTLENRPEIVAISGFDDFSYAVEMLRNGVREYILKPVERDKITSILEKLEVEISHKSHSNRLQEKMNLNQLRFHLLKEAVDEEELEVLQEQFKGSFLEKGFVVCVAGSEFEMTEDYQEFIWLSEMEHRQVIIVSNKELAGLLQGDLASEYCGISRSYSSLRDLRTAFEEAKQARGNAFLRKQSPVNAGADTKHVPEALMLEARKLLSEQAFDSRLQLLGSGRTVELTNSFETLFSACKKEQIVLEELQDSIGTFLEQVKETYSSLLEVEDEKIRKQLAFPESFSDIYAYEEAFMQFIMQIHERGNNGSDAGKNQAKIKEAIAYIQENYGKDLNMAMVSNHVSMNYSLFSYEFKQTTGSNFVTYLKEIRMEEAKRLLVDTEDRIIEVSQKVGYENEKNFMKTFKKLYGVSATEYRKNMQRAK